jgi:hypothetical protein
MLASTRHDDAASNMQNRHRRSPVDRITERQVSARRVDAVFTAQPSIS